MRLYLIPSPIGNLGDISYRAVEILSRADLILCEDTRTTSKLLRHYQIQKPLLPFHQHNEHQMLDRYMDRIREVEITALVTDAGTPGISDPGFLLARECARINLPFECLPGPTAFVPALVQSALPIHRFAFEGFLPAKKGRQTAIRALAEEERTLVFYESPHRLVRTLQDLGNELGLDRPASVSRELTKIYEETRRGSLAELAEYYQAHPPKGEIVLVVAGYEPPRKSRSAQKS